MKDKKLNEHNAVFANNANEQEQYSSDKDRIQWHTGFVQAMRLYEDKLEFAAGRTEERTLMENAVLAAAFVLYIF